jgi:hypothetical protein
VRSALAQIQEPGSTGGEARGGRGLGTKEVAMTDKQRRWLYVVVTAIIGGAVGFLLLWALG